jgi:hypothetical protein
VPSGAGHSITFDDDLSVASGVTITFSLGATVPTVSGDTLTYSGTPSVGLYQDLSSPSSPVTATITSVTIVLSVPSPANGGAVTGTISLTTSAGTFKGSLTGTLSGVS